MSNLGEMLPMEYVGPLAGGGAVPLAVCQSLGTSTGGSFCNTGSGTGKADCGGSGSSTGGALCAPTGAGTGRGWCNNGNGMNIN